MVLAAWGGKQKRCCVSTSLMALHEAIDREVQATHSLHLLWRQHSRWQSMVQLMTPLVSTNAIGLVVQMVAAVVLPRFARLLELLLMLLLNLSKTTMNIDGRIGPGLHLLVYALL